MGVDHMKEMMAAAEHTVSQEGLGNLDKLSPQIVDAALISYQTRTLKADHEDIKRKMDDFPQKLRDAIVDADEVIHSRKQEKKSLREHGMEKGPWAALGAAIYGIAEIVRRLT